DKPALRRWLRSMVYDQTLVTEQLLEERWAQVNEPGVIESMKSLYNPAAIAKVARGEVSFDLADVTAPTLLFWGRDDRVSPVDKTALRRWLRSMVYDQTLVTEQLLEERWAQVNEPGVIESMKSLYNPAAIAKVARGEVSFDLADVTAPTLLFWGRDDRVSPVD